MFFSFISKNKINSCLSAAICFLCLFQSFSLSAQTAKSKQPNIVFLLVDDMGYGECGFNGGKEIATPVIDRLAKEGTILENSYVQPVCSPTRAALLTGRYPIRTGVYSVVTPGAHWGLPLNERTLATALHEAGYYTAITGKWHLGESEKAYLPGQRGFDHQYGFYFGNIDYFTHERNHQPDWYRNGIPLKEEGYSTKLIANEACKIIEESDRSKPLFLYVPFNGIHAPYQVPDKYLAPYSALSGNRKILAGMLAAVDEAIDQIVASINKAGIRENTLIVFLSDNGAPPPGVNLPLRDFKASIYEGGVRGACFVNWPGHIAAGKRITEPMHVVDWYPTLIDLAKGSLKQPLAIDGLDIWSLITKSAASPHDAILSISNRGPQEAAIRIGNWKLIALGANENGSNEKPSPKSLAKYGMIALYNLADDPSETKNLAASYPEKVTAMKKLLTEKLKGAVPSGAIGAGGAKDGDE
jgi:arylsulfatase A-like enzyme